jgi:hypothetical protein
VVIVQHIAADFASSLTLWLQERSPLVVRAAEEGDRPAPGTVLVAATNDHLVMRRDRRLHYQKEPAETPYRPAVDAMFDSLARHWPWPSVAAVLTGIGRDGAQGLLSLRQSGWHTVSQDEATSVVYGMPQAAAQLGAARRTIQPGSRLFLYSDGVHEIHKADGEEWTYTEFVQFMSQPDEGPKSLPNRLLEHVRQLNGSNVLDDDFSMVEVRF